MIKLSYTRGGIESPDGVTMVQVLLKDLQVYNIDTYGISLDEGGVTKWLNELVVLSDKFHMTKKKEGKVLPFWEWSLPHALYGVDAICYHNWNGEVLCAECATVNLLNPFEVGGGVWYSRSNTVVSRVS